MPERLAKTALPPEATCGDLTRQIKALSLPIVDRAPESATPGELKALLVCRSDSFRESGERLLSEMGFQVEAIDDANSALEAARRFVPDVILVEAAVTNSAGISIAEVLQKAEYVEAPLYALTDSPREVEAMLELDVFDVTTRPFDWQLVARRARKVVEHMQLIRQLKETEQSLTSALEVADSARERLRKSESLEPVTGLPNRAKFIDLVGRGIKAVKQDGNALVVFVIGIDRFRLVVEALGPRYAEKVSGEIAARLRQSLGELGDANTPSRGLSTGAVANLGGGSFALMLACEEHENTIVALPRQLRSVMDGPTTIDGQTIHLSTRIGVTYHPRDGADAETLVTRAEMAMHSASDRGNDFQFYSETMDAAAAHELKLEQMIHDAMKRGEFRLAYQPLNDVKTNEIIGVEALLRWPQPDGSFIRPDEFVPVAEETGLMVPLGEFVLREACQQLAAWHAQGHTSLRMCVNVSRCQLLRDDFAPFVEHCLGDLNIRPDRLDLELSERGVLSGDRDVVARLMSLKRIGVKLSIDDFGMGESAIAYLKELPVDTLKIDRSYIRGLLAEVRDTAMTSAMIALAQKLELSVVAEGVETAEQLAMIRSFGCDQYQGFLESPPVEAAEMLVLLQRR